MKRYLITYREYGDMRQWTCKAYDKSHAAEKFNDPDCGFSIDMIERIERIKSKERQPA